MSNDNTVLWTDRHGSRILIACGVAQALFGLFLLSDPTYPVWRASIAFVPAVVLVLMGFSIR